MKEAVDPLEATWPDFDPEGLATKIGDDIVAGLPGTLEENKRKRYGTRIASGRSSLDVTQRVLNPMQAGEVGRFWDFTKPPPVL